jgi:hypothetical protein
VPLEVVLEARESQVSGVGVDVIVAETPQDSD